jgi:hypothetical protein
MWYKRYYLVPLHGISRGVAKKAIRDWMAMNQKKYWESLTGLRQAKGLTWGPSAKRTRE